MKKLFPILAIVTTMTFVVCHREEVGWIAVNSEPQGAAVYLDDSLTSKLTNCVLEDVPVGEHSLKLALEGYVDWDTLVEVKADSAITITATMIPQSDTTDTIPPGTLLWKSSINGYPYVLLYDQGKVYAYLSDGSAYHFSTLDALDGFIEWQQDEGFMSNPPGDVAIGPNGNFYRTEQEYLCSYNPDGSVRWKVKVGRKDVCFSAVSSDDISYWTVWDSICVLNSVSLLERSYGGSPGWFYEGAAVGLYDQFYWFAWDYTLRDTLYLYETNQNGEHVWVFALEGSWQPTYPYMSIGNDGTLYFEIRNSESVSKIVAVDFGQLKWESSIEPTTQLVVGVDGTLYCGSYDYLYALDPEDGSVEWRKSMNYVSDVLIGFDGTVYCSGDYFGLMAVNPEDGSVRWKYDTKQETSYMRSLALAEDGTLFVWAWASIDSLWYLHAIKTESQGLANSSWPTYQHDNRRTGCAGL